MSLVGWYIRHRLKKLAKSIKEGDVNIQTVLSWLGNLKFIPSGYLTKAGGWLGIISAVACMLGHPIAWLPCATDPVTSLTAGLIGVGLGRRGTQ